MALKTYDDAEFYLVTRSRQGYNLTEEGRAKRAALAAERRARHEAEIAEAKAPREAERAELAELRAMKAKLEAEAAE